MLGFYFDQSACNGCKACSMACQDKHDLPVGVQWRRIYEYTGGTWSVDGATATPNIFTYYTSISCNHCDNPVCVEVCPTTAMHRDDDGVVSVDPDKCIGCRYCEWVCSYSAPQFNPDKGIMTKCDLCADYRAEGQNPACVDACPSRALDWGPIDELRAQYGDASGIAPLPNPEVTKPNLVITPHKKAQSWDEGTGSVANQTSEM
ncbi:DMSO/selenate family reductase complex B subunit [Propioniferax innocua]|uniref:Anaerobic dimethyl sulfoxide reductase subunit B (Iron-sulfur subunit) n=1 Tax=Propioniferax innocua TaxID=1753 RepID=A0A542ZQ45_9ACTN|nr:DMSO/selenate family reductase complex B subunit [Propioniferax innocua]TQL62359.1 anaerobic dimethyl sulfoxide reductase subunit B (iron-sulfur subunit) [Propioniferax innocua]